MHTYVYIYIYIRIIMKILYIFVLEIINFNDLLVFKVPCDIIHLHIFHYVISADATICYISNLLKCHYTTSVYY